MQYFCSHRITETHKCQLGVDSTRVPIWDQAVHWKNRQFNTIRELFNGTSNSDFNLDKMYPYSQLPHQQQNQSGETSQHGMKIYHNYPSIFKKANETIHDKSALDKDNICSPALWIVPQYCETEKLNRIYILCGLPKYNVYCY